MTAVMLVQNSIGSSSCVASTNVASNNPDPMSGKVRIISGQWRGRRVQVPDQPGLRPTSDRAREVLFNWLRERVHGARCLDLFAGTGALGLEAASRGAARVTLVERDRRLSESLRGLAGEWPGGEALDVVRSDAIAWLKRGGADDSARFDLARFDLVFVDPPFDAGLHVDALRALADSGILEPDARIYVESSARAAPPIAEDDADWRIVRDKRLGEVRMQLATPAASLAPDPHSL